MLKADRFGSIADLKKAGAVRPLQKTDKSRLRIHQKKVTAGAYQAESILTIAVTGTLRHATFCRRDVKRQNLDAYPAASSGKRGQCRRKFLAASGRISYSGSASFLRWNKGFCLSICILKIKINVSRFFCIWHCVCKFILLPADLLDPVGEFKTQNKIFFTIKGFTHYEIQCKIKTVCSTVSSI